MQFKARYNVIEFHIVFILRDLIVLLGGVVVWIAVCFVCERACRERNRRSRSREVGGTARQADGTAEAGSFLYGLMRFVFFEGFNCVVLWYCGLDCGWLCL